MKKGMFVEIKKASSWYVLNEADIQYGTNVSEDELETLANEFDEWLSSIETRFEQTISTVQLKWFLRKARIEVSR